ncbi:FecR domain-containing protein [Mucilaginibacter sp. BJC16-A38]|uniref:FecR family protein n=1 Tax=Mucilaginibacter phenanthrenivorans TaxID=1234842 RepID=UPI0021577FCF|nr:FecR family protein [Mucilaginibacter phenanthrenivorans]MCR8561598.1 FecR domain-containing protein [Mucilaginibacter phenanthrenivorans]
MTDKQIVSLLKKYGKGKLNPEEKAILESWYLKQAESSSNELSDAELDKNLALIRSNLVLKQQPVPKFNWQRVAVAASLLIFAAFGAHFFLHKKDRADTAKIVKKDASPGKNRATLILSNGKKIILGDASNGQLASDAGVTINKTKSGEIIYKANAAPGNDTVKTGFNTLTTAKGEQYQLILPDGSHVWLNAASSVKYPVVFDKKERMVELNGEAYFEVVHKPESPFKVKTRRQEVEVLGTHFNIYAYDDESITRTTLVEGSVKVSAFTSHNTIVIKPGQQSLVDDYNLKVETVDTDDALAWKNGYFEFNDESLESIMKKVGRWYNLDVEYRNTTAKNQLFSGSVSRYKNVSQVIKTLELTNAVHFKIEGNTILVIK